MTKKRFAIDNNGYLIDRDTHKLIEYDEECCELLNGLSEENEHLKKEVEEYKEAMKRMMIDMMGG